MQIVMGNQEVFALFHWAETFAIRITNNPPLSTTFLRCQKTNRSFALPARSRPEDLVTQRKWLISVESWSLIHINACSYCPLFDSIVRQGSRIMYRWRATTTSIELSHQHNITRMCYVDPWFDRHVVRYQLVDIRVESACIQEISLLQRHYL